MPHLPQKKHHQSNSAHQHEYLHYSERFSSDEDSDYYSDEWYEDDDVNSVWSDFLTEEDDMCYDLEEIKIGDSVYTLRVPVNGKEMFVELLEVIEGNYDFYGRVHWNAGNFYCSDYRDKEILREHNVNIVKYLPIDFSSSIVIMDRDCIMVRY